MNKLRNLGLVTIIAMVCGMFVAGCSGNEDLKPVAPDPELKNQPATTDGMGSEMPSGAKKTGG
jgi:hypothetical protein